MPIFDQGYQHWQGTLGNHAWRWLAVARHGVRVGMQNRVLRFLIIVAWIPALGLAGVICLWGLVEQKATWAVSFLASWSSSFQIVAADPFSFRVTMWTFCFDYFIIAEMFFVMLVVMVVGPSLISQDLRFNALPLYFSRPVRRIDYFLGKLGVIGFFLGLVTVVPAVAAWFLGVLFSLDFSVIPDTFRILLGVILYGVVVTLSAGLFMLALSSLTRNSRYVGAIWAGVCIITYIVSVVLQIVHAATAVRSSIEAQRQLQQAENQGWKQDQQERDQDQQNLQLKEEERQARELARQQRQAERQRARLHEGELAQTRMQRQVAEAFRDDWRPCVSYTRNLLRIGDALLGTYGAADRWNALQAAATAGRPRAHFGGPNPQEIEEDEEPIASPRYPWYWSGIVLVALGGFSVWILNSRVKNLDRLR